MLCVQFRFFSAAGWLQQQINVFFVQNDDNNALTVILLPMINQLQNVFSITVVLCRIITDEDISRVWDCVVTGIDMMAEEQADG